MVSLRNLNTKPSQRFDFLLFFYVMGLLIGSAVWLRLIPSGDLSGRGIQTPLWLEPFGSGRSEEGRPLPSINGLTLHVNEGSCNYTTAEDAAGNGCGVDSPLIEVTASISEHAHITRGVSLAIYSSNDFEFWRQANSIELPRDMFKSSDSSTELLATSGPMSVTTSACFGEPGAYYVVACAREGVPPGGAASVHRPTCQMPPCAGSVGPPFSMCLGIAAACISTCESGATEVIPQRQFLNGQEPRCANGTIPMPLIQKYAEEGSGISPAYLAFMLCYTIGVVYFLIMYLPGIGANDAISPSWDLFLAAVLEQGHVVVKLHRKGDRALETPEHLLKSTRAIDIEAQQQEDFEMQKKRAELTRRLVKGRVTAAANMHKKDKEGQPSPTFQDPQAGPSRSQSQSTDDGEESPPAGGGGGGSSSSVGSKGSKSRVGFGGFDLVLPEAVGEHMPTLGFNAARKDSMATMRFRRPTFCEQSLISSDSGSTLELSDSVGPIRGARSKGEIPPGLPPGLSKLSNMSGHSEGSTAAFHNPILALKTFEEAELEMHEADSEQSELLRKNRRQPMKSMLRFEMATIDDEDSIPNFPPPAGPPSSALGQTRMGMRPQKNVSRNNTLRRKAKEFAKQAPLEGVTPVMFSISASEGPNILLRNFLGKIATNLSVGLDLKRLPSWHLIDGFADEGHRIGAYYMFRAISIAFYESLNPSIALRVVSSWLEAINGHEHANNVDKFDKEKQTDLFALLSPVDQARPQVCFVKFFFKIFRSLNAFTVSVDELFDRLLFQPFISPGVYAKAMEYVKSADKVTEKGLMEATGIATEHEARVVLVACQNDDPDEPNPYASSLANLMGSGLVKQKTELAPPTDPSQSEPANRAKMHFKEDPEEEPVCFFSADFVNTFGHLLGVDFKDGVKEGEPVHFGAFLACLQKLDGKDPLRCTAFTKIAPALEPDELTSLLSATKRRWLSYDHVKIVAGAKGKCKAMYVARGRPDQWKPETKKDHRRALTPGCWACRVPNDDTDDEFWAARREIALVHGVSEHHVVAHFYTDLQHAGKDRRSARVKEGVDRIAYDKLKVLNTHLGKAGGLNFGIEAILHSNIVPKPSPTQPMIFAIVDARHSSDSRWWNYILPSFFEVHDLEDRVMFNPDVVLCQVPHSYIGMNAITDKLDVQNNFFFDGMACFRDRCNGMTSCGTGGIWSITSHLGTGDYFFGRTMIEDTTSTHKYFLQGFHSTYIPPLYNSKQLMRAVPKIGANYVDALERWDTGAIQSLLTQGFPRAWFWTTFACLILVALAVMAPAFTAGIDMVVWFRRPWDPEHIFATCCILYSAGIFSILILTVLTLAMCSRPALNWCLRFLVMFFNVTYPFTSIFGLFWIIIPPYVAFTGLFPFTLNAQFAAIGSLFLKMFEFGAVGKLQAVTHLDEHSIGMTQKMDKVGVPIKLRAIMKGFTTGWNDRYHYHDNSWWVSFGASATLMWIRRWLLFLVGLQVVTLVAAVTHLIVVAFRGLAPLIEKAMPLLYAMLASIQYLLLLNEPFMYLMKGSTGTIPPRWLEVGVALLMIGGIFGFLEATRIINSS